MNGWLASSACHAARMGSVKPATACSQAATAAAGVTGKLA
jgi:hypothetical protein